MLSLNWSIGWLKVFSSGEILASNVCLEAQTECDKQESQWWPSHSRKESTLNCLLIGNRDFICKREIKKQIKKISNLLEENKTETAIKVNARMKTTAYLNDLHYMEGKANEQQPIWNDWALKVKNIARQKIGCLSKYYIIFLKWLSLKLYNIQIIFFILTLFFVGDDCSSCCSGCTTPTSTPQTQLFVHLSQNQPGKFFKILFFFFLKMRFHFRL